eukprot:TRINITY_DN63886_c0_g1_i1.p1 TRINITY_DN63886_c0_g1~~TRINITY_DN63886_c0_g1_i1.p1  ORF type:complete len:641 (-),score=91.25 TRINITY_DN63886_c0_g1_i1:288-2210(-)
MGCTSSTAVPDAVHDKSSRSPDASAEAVIVSEIGKDQQNQSKQLASTSSGAGSTEETKDSSKSGSCTVNSYFASVKKLLARGEAPTGPELIAFGRYLGIDPAKDRDLMWIAVEALSAPLPAEWTEHYDTKGNLFYYDQEHKASSWTHPLEPVHREAYKTITNFKCSFTHQQQVDELKKLIQEYEAASSDAALVALDWTEHTDHDGNTFYYNKVQRRSTWNDPRLALAHRLNLQQRIIDFLKSDCGLPTPRAEKQMEEEILICKESLKRGMSFGQEGSASAPGSPEKPLAPPGVDSFSIKPVPRYGKEWQVICQLLHVTDPENLGLGRDVKESCSKAYNSLRPVMAWRLERQTHWRIFDATRSMVVEDLKRISKIRSVPKVKSKLDAAIRWLGGAEEACNEQILLHGTKPENLVGIIHNGLSEKICRGLLGHGVYLAEDPSKMDQYCTADDVAAGTKNLSQLHSWLYSADNPHPGRVFYAVVCRVVLGMPICTKNGKTDLKPPHTSIFRASDKRELALIPKCESEISYHSLIAEPGPVEDGYLLQRHREFVVFNCNRILEQYIVAFTREQSSSPNRGPPPIDLEEISFCDDEAARVAPRDVSRRSFRSTKERLQELLELKEGGFVTDSEYEAKRKALLDEL